MLLKRQNILPNLQLQQPRAEVPLQHGAVQIVGPQLWRRLSSVSALHGGPPLSLLQGGVLPRPEPTDHPPESVQK
ncbi:hypothetical protein M8J75_015762 [Diaphorina citri]|nr:hypothetical protein M8J75_015762 [Diaphorina citri]